MSFPLTAFDQTWPEPPALAAAAHADAVAGGGSVSPDNGPATWLYQLHEQGLLNRELSVGLCAALLQSDEAGPVAEAARLAALLGGDELADLLRLGWQGLDIGLLLAADPFHPGLSVEDALVTALAAVADLTDDATRNDVLSASRNAGHSLTELRVLLSHGSATELLHWLPAALGEAAEQESAVLQALHATLADADRAEALLPALQSLPMARREALATGISDPMLLGKLFASAPVPEVS